MATQKGVNRTKADTPTSDNVLAPGTLGGRVRVMQDAYTFASEAVNDTILLFEDLKAGAIIQDIVVDLVTTTNAVILDVGDSADPDRYINGLTATSIASNRGQVTAAGGLFQSTGVQYAIGTATGDDKIIITVLVAVPTDGSIKLSLYYTED